MRIKKYITGRKGSDLPDPARRKVLGGLAIAPVTAGAFVKQIETKFAGTEMPSVLGGMGPAPEAPKKERKRFFDFLSYMRDKEDIWWQEAKVCSHIDPDLASLHLPLATIMRIQRQRHFDEIKRRNEKWFNRVFKRNGVFEFDDWD